MRWDDDVYFEVSDVFTTICDDLKVTWYIDTYFIHNYSIFGVTSGTAKGCENRSVIVYWNPSRSVYDILNTLKNYLLICLDERIKNYDWSVIMKYFTKKDLKNGDVVVLRNENVGIAIPDQNVIVFDDGSFERISNYADDLRICDNYFPPMNIVKVYRPNQPYQCRFHPDGYTEAALVYERKEVEEMTLEEICKALGKEIKIKIVKEK